MAWKDDDKSIAARIGILTCSRFEGSPGDDIASMVHAMGMRLCDLGSGYGLDEAIAEDKQMGGY